MAQKTMYPAINNSPVTTLAAAVTNNSVTIEVVDSSVLPAAPNIATIGNDDTAELVLYTGISGNSLTGCTRGFNSTTKKAWPIGSKIYRAFTAYDHDTFRENIADLVSSRTTDEAAIQQNVSDISALTGRVSANETAIAGKASVADHTALAARVTANESAIGTLEALEKSRGFTPAQLQEIAQSGNAADYFEPGDIITIPWTDYTPATPVTYQYPFVITHIGDVVDDQEVTHHNAIYLMAMYATPQTIQFDHPEVIVATEETFQEDTYYYIKNGDDWVEQTVTAGDAIPAGTTYYKHSRTGMAGRIRYGSNNYKESAFRQWLNSSGDKGEWWIAQHDSDVAPDQANTVPGFLTGFTAEWLAIFKPVQIKCYRNTACDGGGWDTMYDKFFLPSVEEMYGSPQLSGEGVYWEYWKEETGLNSPSNGASSNTNDARKIPSITAPDGAAVYVRLRSAYRSNANSVWYVYAAGYLTYNHAYTAYRAQPACVIY